MVGGIKQCYDGSVRVCLSHTLRGCTGPHQTAIGGVGHIISCHVIPFPNYAVFTSWLFNVPSGL